MKKTNIVFLAVAAVVSIFLLWLWYFLNFNLVDNPLDLVLSIIWWVIAVGVIFAVTKVEQRRQQRIRTVYLAKGEMFNSEEGLVAIESKEGLADSMKEMLVDLEYNFKRNDFPEEEEFTPLCMVRTMKLKVKKEEDQEDEWEGEVVNVLTKGEYEFKNEDELKQLLRVEFAG